jgi:hypothetical protein
MLPLVVVLAVWRERVDELVRRAPEEVATYSLAPSAYFQPTSHTYVGFFALGLALASLAFRPPGGWLRLSLALLAIVGFACSLRPGTSLVGLELPMPSELVHSVVPYFRVFARLAVLVSLAVAILAAFALDRLFAARQVVWSAAGGMLALAAAADLWRSLPDPAADLGSQDAVAEELAAGSGAVAEYPLFGFDNDRIGDYLLRQLRHTRPLLNGSVDGTLSATLADAAGSLRSPQARAALTLAGVTDVVVNPPAETPSGAGFAFLRRSGDGAALYSVAPAPGEVAVAAIAGAWPTEEAADGSPFSWLAPGARLEVATNAPGRVLVELDAVSHATGRLVSFGDAGVRPVALSPTRISICVQTGANGSATLPISSRPAAAPLPAGDPRVATIGVFHLVARAGCA